MHPQLNIPTSPHIQLVTDHFGEPAGATDAGRYVEIDTRTPDQIYNDVLERWARDAGYMLAYGDTVAANGFVIVPLARGKKYPFIKDWQARTESPSEDQVAAWAQASPGCGIGIVTGKEIGVDLDISDPIHAEACRLIVFEHLGPTRFIRIGRDPRMMLVYRVEKALEGFKPHPFELIGKGQQFVSHHIHKDTKRPYYWPDENILDTHVDDLPLVTHKQVHEAFAALSAYAKKHHINSKGEVDTSIDDQDDLELAGSAPKNSDAVVASSLATHKSENGIAAAGGSAKTHAPYTPGKYRGWSDEAVLADCANGTHGAILALMARYGARYGNTTKLREKVDEVKPHIVECITKVSTDEDDFRRRCREEIDGDKLYVSALKIAVTREDAKQQEAKRATTPVPATKKLPSGDVGCARAKLDALMRDEEKASQAYEPVTNAGSLKIGSRGIALEVTNTAPHTIYNATVGSSKSTTRMKAIEPKNVINQRINWYGPNHELAEQATNDLRKQLGPKLKKQFGLKDDEIKALIRQHKGRRQPGMCINKDLDPLCREVEDFGGSPYNEVCEKLCDKHDRCPSVKQKTDNGPGVVVKAHTSLLTDLRYLPPFICDDNQRLQVNPALPQRNVVDESLLGTILSIQKTASKSSRSRRKVSDLEPRDGDDLFITSRVTRLDKQGNVVQVSESNDAATTKLRTGREVMCKLLRAATEPFVCADQVRISRDELSDWRTLEKLHRETLGRSIRQLQKKADNADTSTAAEARQQIKALRKVFSASMLATNIYTLLGAVHEMPGRRTVYGLRVYGTGHKRDVHAVLPAKIPKAASYIPTSYLDGTGDERVMRAIIGAHHKSDHQPQVTFRSVEAKPVNYNFTQIASDTFAKTALLGDLTDNPGRKQRADAKMNVIERFIAALSCKHPGKGEDGKDALVICTKDFRKRLEPHSPVNVAFLHFGKLKGQNGFEKVPALVVIGRDTPNMETLELMTEALFWDDPTVTTITRAEKWPSNDVELLMADGSARIIKGERHPDDLVESVRRQVVDAEIAQAIGRARLVMRGENGRPCHVYYFGKIDTGTPAHEVITDLGQLDYTHADIMIADGLVFKSGATVARAWPRFMSSDASRQRMAAKEAWGAWQGSDLGHKKCCKAPIIKNPSIGDKQHFCSFSVGAFKINARAAAETNLGTNKQQIAIDRDKHQDPVTAIAARLRLPADAIEWLGWVEDHTVENHTQTNIIAWPVAENTTVH